MKKISLLLLSVLMAICLFTACGDDDKKPDIIGNWKYQKTIIENVQTTSADASDSIRVYLSDSKNESIQYTSLNVDDEGLVLSDGEFVGTVLASGNDLRISFVGFSSSANCKADGNSLSIRVVETENIRAERLALGIEDDVKIESVVVKREYVRQ